MDKQTTKNLLKIVECNYQKIADDFNQTRKKYLWPGIIKIAQIIKPGDKILDVGCGNGRLLETLKEKSADYLGVDKSTELIKIAEKKYQSEKIKFRPGCILELGQIPEINFDYIFCIAVIHHLPGKNLRIQALKQLKNKVAENGRIILTVWNLWSQKKYQKLIWKFWFLKLIGKNKMDFGDVLFDWKNPQGEKVSKRYYHAFCGHELKKIVKKSGLKIAEFYKDKHNFYLVLKK